MKTTETEKSAAKTSPEKDNTTKESSMNRDESESKNMMTGGYGRFALMMTISFVIMYAVMFLNVSEFNHIYLSLNRFYMTLLMVAPMAVVMMGLMNGMYKNKRVNAGIIAAGIGVFILALVCLRTQAFVGDGQYMRGMIPHHSSAIMASNHAAISDPEVKKLSQDIIEAQEREIALMKQLLEKTKFSILLRKTILNSSNLLCRQFVRLILKEY